jgi:glycosyltransferase involved in cell wall biosynthesis
LAYLERFRNDAQAVVHWRGFRRILTQARSDELFAILSDPGLNVRRDLAMLLARERLRPDAGLPGKGRFYLNVGHTALQQPGFVRWTQTADIRPVYMVHDLIPITHPEFCRVGEAERHSSRVQNMLASAVGIIGNSKATLESLSHFADSLAMPTPPMIDAPLGTEIGRSQNEAVAAPGPPTFVMLGTIEARKNHLLLLQIWARLVRSLGDDAPRLLIIGQRGWECEQVFGLLDRSTLLRSAVTEIRSCSDARLESYLREARALVFPTLVEGYGLPLIEALARGTPVIASDLPVFHEIGQEIPDFIDPLDGPAWYEAILDYAATPSPRRDDQLARMGAYRVPSWDAHFASVSAWLATL